MSSIHTRMMGHVVEIEYDNYLVRSGPYDLPHQNKDIMAKCFGWGKQFIIPHKPAAYFICWFHFPIPTVQWMNNSTLFLDSLFFYFNSDDSIAINEIHLWDGSARVWEISMAEMSGDWKNPRTIQGSPRPGGNNLNPRWMRGSAIGDRIEFHTGLSISLKALVKDIGQITFHSAGAAWVDAPR